MKNNNLLIINIFINPPPENSHPHQTKSGGKYIVSTFAKVEEEPVKKTKKQLVLT
jgi:hypothetical protein